MAQLNLLQRAALTLYVIPFFVGGILLGTLFYSWLNQHAHLPAWTWPLMLVFSVVGILLGALIAYFILMLGLFWLLHTVRFLSKRRLTPRRGCSGCSSPYSTPCAKSLNG